MRFLEIIKMDKKVSIFKIMKKHIIKVTKFHQIFLLVISQIYVLRNIKSIF